MRCEGEGGLSQKCHQTGGERRIGWSGSRHLARVGTRRASAGQSSLATSSLRPIKCDHVIVDVKSRATLGGR
jgi:hypothetical protein